ncbi:hypothetical protein AV530_012506 [Patagioenas fasciata monilis]|uniref:Uncharacterized protein n=1 Tax=Patagioenas fasciata monilis TaxID=372326 RepID=A0A1V4JBA1_PATFA|nr:hypothetical protein AV530_012506 [Patagioenas fasciata monilis]
MGTWGPEWVDGIRGWCTEKFLNMDSASGRSNSVVTSDDEIKIFIPCLNFPSGKNSSTVLALSREDTQRSLA